MAISNDHAKDYAEEIAAHTGRFVTYSMGAWMNNPPAWCDCEKEKAGMKTITDDQLTSIIDLLTDMAADIENEAFNRYCTSTAEGGYIIHPAQKRRYDRDTASAKEARRMVDQLKLLEEVAE
jgi:hypothetical protein